MAGIQSGNRLTLIIILAGLAACITSCRPLDNATATNQADNRNVDFRADSSFRIAFYNVENLFDPQNDSLKNDEDFTPEGQLRWTYKRYWRKQHNLARVFAEVGQGLLPEIIGLCEIENRRVLEDLCQKTGLEKFGYQIIHYDSPDQRGIDVGLLYKPAWFRPITHRPLRVSMPDDSLFFTRDILYVSGLADHRDTLHIFINHWPSRRGGRQASESKRLRAAAVLRQAIDSIQKNSPEANIVIMGDFNDYPYNKSLYEILYARWPSNNPGSTSLYNLSLVAEKHSATGTHKFAGHWGTLDQIIVSGALLRGNSGLFTTAADAHICNAPFLLIDEKNKLGQLPFRTYAGFNYQGGFSDHLPVYLDLYTTKDQSTTMK